MIPYAANSSMMITDIAILGASTRAAAFSALRAGMHPLCADLFADADLTLRCPTLTPAPYPVLVEQLLRLDPPPGWMYTGGLENRPELVEQLACKLPLWGNGAGVLSRCRSPGFVHELLTAAGLPCPAIRDGAGTTPPGRWLLKPLQGAGGRGIRFWNDGETGSRTRSYAQQYVEGTSCSAIYVGNGVDAALLGVTRQLVGEGWLHAGPFRYCGSIGPIDPLPELHQLGNVLTKGCGLRGLFGIDFIDCDGTPWPVEVNPRYTASVEVLEFATGLSAISLHRAGATGKPVLRTPYSVPHCRFVGKAILFAPVDITFPDNASWLCAAPVDRMPAFADVPPTGQPIRKGQPVMSFFTSADSVKACRDALRDIAAALDLQLFPGYKEDN